ncbi:MAG: hypothetical protein Fur0020_01160 [Thermodesulfovibrionia bacterium]
MDDLLVILRKPPYGLINAAEAIRHAGGASGSDYRALLYLIDVGVLTAKKGQDAGDTGFTCLGESIELLSGEMEIYVNKQSLHEYNISEDELIDGVRIDDGKRLKEAIKTSQAIMIF